MIKTTHMILASILLNFSAVSNPLEEETENKIFAVSSDYMTATINNKSKIKESLQTPRLNEQERAFRSQLGEITLKTRNFDLKCIHTVLDNRFINVETITHSFGLQIDALPGQSKSDYYRVIILNECGNDYVSEASIFELKLIEKEFKIDANSLLNSIHNPLGLTQSEIDHFISTTNGIIPSDTTITEEYTPNIGSLQLEIRSQINNSGLR